MYIYIYIYVYASKYPHMFISIYTYIYKCRTTLQVYAEEVLLDVAIDALCQGEKPKGDN